MLASLAKTANLAILPKFRQGCWLEESREFDELGENGDSEEISPMFMTKC